MPEASKTQRQAIVDYRKTPKFDNARQLRSIYIINPADEEFKETIENARIKLEVPMLAGRFVALRLFATQNTHASLKPTNLRESVWKGFQIKIMKITLQGKDSFH